MEQQKKKKRAVAFGLVAVVESDAKYSGSAKIKSGMYRG